MTRIPRTCLLAIAALAAFAGCADVGYNPYTRNDAKRPVSKTIEAGPDAVYRGINKLDARFDNMFH